MSSNLDDMLKESPTPTLTLDPFGGAADAPAAKAPNPPVEAAPKVPEVVLTPEEQKMVDDFAAQIDISDTQLVMRYGAGSQKKIADFSENALNNVRTKDMGEIGQMLTDVVTELKEFDEEEEKGLFGFFKKTGNKLDNLKVKYDKAEANINRICKVMEDHQVTLLKDAAMLDKMYELNLNYFRSSPCISSPASKSLLRPGAPSSPRCCRRRSRAAFPRTPRQPMILPPCASASRKRSTTWS